MKTLMLVLSLSIIATAGCAGTLEETRKELARIVTLSPRLDNVEPLLMAGKHMEARHQFLRDNRPTASGRQPHAYNLSRVYVPYLEQLADYHSVHEFNIDSINTVRMSRGNLVIRRYRIDMKWIDRKRPAFKHYSPEFIAWVDNRIEQIRVGYPIVLAAYEQHQGELAMAERAKEEEQAAKVKAAQQAAEQARQRAQAERQARKDKRTADARAAERAQRHTEAERVEEQARATQQRVSEAARLDESARAHGYAGYENIRIVSMMRKARREGGLENYLNRVMDGRGHPKITIMQITEDALLYSSHVDGSIFIVLQESGKMYLEGQRLANGHYAFLRMQTYETALGSTKTVPLFQKVNLQ